MELKLPDSITSSLVGLWYAVSEIDGGTDQYICILEDLRYIGVFNGYIRVGDAPMKWLWQTARIWMELEADSVVRCRYKRGGSSWTRLFYFEGEWLIIATTIPQIETEASSRQKVCRCCRITVQDLPAGVEEVFSKAMARPWT